jgi:hypothetical protein
MPVTITVINNTDLDHRAFTALRAGRLVQLTNPQISAFCVPNKITQNAILYHDQDSCFPNKITQITILHHNRDSSRWKGQKAPSKLAKSKKGFYWLLWWKNPQGVWLQMRLDPVLPWPGFPLLLILVRNFRMSAPCPLLSKAPLMKNGCVQEILIEDLGALVWYGKY